MVSFRNPPSYLAGWTTLDDESPVLVDDCGGFRGERLTPPILDLSGLSAAVGDRFASYRCCLAWGKAACELSACWERRRRVAVPFDCDETSSRRFHFGRTARGDRDHRPSHRAAVASGERGVRFDHRHLHPSTKATPVVRLSLHSDALEKLRSEYEENENDDQAAQNYVSALRVYCESYLMHLLNVPDPLLPEKPALGNILAAIHRYSNSGHEPFSCVPIRALLDSYVFRSGSQLRDILNRAHHHTLADITCGEVDRIADDAKTAKRLVDSAHVAYECHLRRDQEPPRDVGPVHCMARDLHFSAPSVEALAAADGESIEWQGDDSEGPFESALFGCSAKPVDAGQ